MRYSRGIRIIVSIMYIINMILYLALVLYTPSLALTILTGLNLWVSVCSVGAVGIFYTALGGIKAVMWTDVFQVSIMFLGLFAIIIQGSIDHGGFGNIWKIMDEGKRINFWDFDIDPTKRHSFWVLSFGAGLTWASTYGVNQAQVQRSLSTPKLSTGQIALWLNVPGLTALVTLCSMCGFVVYAEYRDCDPLTGPEHIKRDQLLPLYVRDHLDYPVVPGLFTAAVFSGSLSSISSGLNALAAVVLQDMIRPYSLPRMTDSTAANISKGIAVSFGGLMILLTYVASLLGGVLQAVYMVFGVIGGPILGIFTLGMTNPWSNNIGACVGFITGVLATSWAGVGAFIYKPYVYKPPVSLAQCDIDNATDAMTMYLNYSTSASPVLRPEDKPGYLTFYELSYLWYTLFAVIVVNVVGTVVSLLTGAANREDVDPRLLTPIVRSLCCCLPVRVRRCNIDETRGSFDDGQMTQSQNTETTSHANEAIEVDTRT